MLDGPARITNPKVTGVVKLTSVNGNATTSQDGLRYLEGQIRFQVSGETTERSIHFLEFYDT